MNKFGAIKLDAGRRHWSRNVHGASSTHVPTSAKKYRCVYWSKKVETTSQEKVKPRFERAAEDRAPLILQNKLETENIGMQSGNDTGIPPEIAVEIGAKNPNCWRPNPKFGWAAKTLLNDRQFCPLKFFDAPNFAQQDFAEVRNNRTAHWSDIQFFYVCPETSPVV